MPFGCGVEGGARSASFSWLDFMLLRLWLWLRLLNAVAVLYGVGARGCGAHYNAPRPWAETQRQSIYSSRQTASYQYPEAEPSPQPSMDQCRCRAAALAPRRQPTMAAVTLAQRRAAMVAWLG